MSNRKRVNPNRVPASAADVKRGRVEGIEQGAHMLFAVTMNVLKDKAGVDDDFMREMWEAIKKLLDEVAEHRVSLADLDRVLKEEYGIVWQMT